MSVELSVIIAIVGAIGTLSAVIFAIVNFTSSKSKSAKDDANAFASMQSSIAVVTAKLDLMLEGIGEVKREIAMQGTELQSHKEKVAKEIGDLKLELKEVKHKVKSIEENMK